MKKFYEYWNEKVKDWNSSHEKCFNKDIYSQIHKGKKHGLQSIYLPEPYLGDAENCSAVIINKNPGSPIEKLQKNKVGKFLIQEKAHEDYHEFAKKFIYLSKKYPESGDWWMQRVSWIERLSGIKNCATSSKKPFALEVCPWHSDLFNKNDLILKNYKSQYIEYIREMVVAPAEFANSYSDLGIILSVGSFFNYIFGGEILNFKKCVDLNNQSFPNDLKWHYAKSGKPVKVQFTVWKSQTETFYLNFASGAGFNKVPAEKWQDIEKFILEKIEEMGRLCH